MHPIDPEKACPFVGETLKELRKVVGHAATVLGFVGCPYTLATYLVEVRLEGQKSNIKQNRATFGEFPSNFVQYFEKYTHFVGNYIG